MFYMVLYYYAVTVFICFFVFITLIYYDSGTILAKIGH